MQYSYARPKKQYCQGFAAVQEDFGFPTIPKIPSADVPKNEQGASPAAHDSLWLSIPIAERFELLATIREVREWRYGDCEPLRPLQPIRQAALALHQWLNRHPDVQ